MGRGKPPADPVEAARVAREELRAEVRAAHEAMKGMREAEADLRAFFAEAKEFALTVVPSEIKRQLAEVEPAAIAKVTATCDRLEAILLGTKDDGQPNIEELITARAHRNGAKPGAMACRNCGDGSVPGPVMACPHCGAPNDVHEPFKGTNGAVPWRGAVTVCVYCWKVSVFATSPIGELIARKPTPDEAVKFARDETLQRAIGERRRAKDRTRAHSRGLSSPHVSDTRGSDQSTVPGGQETH